MTVLLTSGGRPPANNGNTGPPTPVPLTTASFDLGDGPLTDGSVMGASLCTVRFICLSELALPTRGRIPGIICGNKLGGGTIVRPVTFGSLTPHKR
jgi:hypothetical protein